MNPLLQQSDAINATVSVTLASGQSFNLIDVNGECNYHYAYSSLLKTAGVVCASDMLEAMLRSMATSIAFGTMNFYCQSCPFLYSLLLAIGKEQNVSH